MTGIEDMLPGPDDRGKDSKISLHLRIAELETVIAAVRNGEVDSLVGLDHVVSLKGADKPYQAFFEAMNEGGLTLDAAGCILHCNPSFAALAGMRVEALRGQEFAKLLDEGSRARFSACRKIDDKHIFEAFLADSGGTLIPVRLSLRPLDVEQVQMACVVVTDLRTQKAAMLALSDSEARYRSILDNSADAVLISTPEGRCIYANNEASQLLGFSHDELLKLSILDIATDEKAESSYVGFQDLLRTGGLKRELRLRHKDGGQVLVEVSAILLPDGNVFGSCRDISKRLAAEQELAHYRENLEELVLQRTKQVSLGQARTEAILRSMLDGVIQINHRGTIVTVNQVICDLFGYEEQELIGGNIKCLMPEPVHSLHDGYLARYMKDRKRSVIGELREVMGQTKNGDLIPIELAVNELVDDSGSTYIGVIHDLRQRKLIEKDREEARLAAEKLAIAKSEFLANMSHEIRTPLNGILGLAQIGYRDHFNVPPVRQNYERILESGQLLLTIINDILDFSKIEAGKLTIEDISFDPAKLVDGTVEKIGVLAAVKNVNLGNEKCDLPDACLGDPVRISQVLLNLLSNAVKFTEQGEVCVETRRMDDQLVFSIRDTGIGMSAEVLENLFMPFEQADSSTTRRFGGTGLGLSISKRLTELMGGTLSAESFPGRGSTFTLSLPLRESDAAPIPSVVLPNNVGHRLHGFCVLVAEDNEVNQLVIEDLLIGEAAEVVMVENGRLATEAIARNPNRFDVVLMDVQMPEMDGLDATRWLRMNYPHVPVIGQTAHALREEHDKCVAAGMISTLTKPIIVDELVAAIHTHTQGRHMGLKAETKATIGGGATLAPPPILDAAIDLSVPLRALRNNSTKARQLIEMFLASSREELPKLKVALDKQDWPMLKAAGHRLKSPARSLGMVGLGELYHSLEDDENRDREELMREALGQIDLLLDRIADIVAEDPRLASLPAK